MTPEEIDFEKEMTYGLMTALECETFGDAKGLKIFCSKSKGGMKCCAMMCCYFGCCASSMKPKMKTRFGFDPNADLDFSKWLKMIEERTEANGGFLQGSEIKVLDLSLYGMLYNFTYPQPVPIISDLFIKSPKLFEWYKNVEKTVGEIHKG